MLRATFNNNNNDLETAKGCANTNIAKQKIANVWNDEYNSWTIWAHTNPLMKIYKNNKC